MRKKILIFAFVLFLTTLFSINNSSVDAAKTNIGDSCYYCPKLADKPNYNGQPLGGDPAFDDPGSRTAYPAGTNINDIGSPFCEYTSATNEEILAAKPANNHAACVETKECSDTDGCTGEDTDPGRCSNINQPCRGNSECNTGNNCSLVFCTSNANHEAKCSDADSGDCSCRPLDSEPECPEGKTCSDSTPTPNTPLSQPCTDVDDKWGCLKINTALGNVDTQAPEFVRWVLSFVLGISGAIVLIIIIITGYRLMTSQGDPEKVKNAREALTAAIVGLLFIIFSLVILQFITVNVLQLPGFGG